MAGKRKIDKGDVATNRQASFRYELLWGERVVRSVANRARRPASSRC